MSELKWKYLDELYREKYFDKDVPAVYLKSEADKVIAELKETLNNRRNARKYWRKEYLIEYKECSHQKYKRCLAMARIALDDWHLHNSFYAMGHQEFEKRKCEFYEKWHKRWLAIAEKFKEAK